MTKKDKTEPETAPVKEPATQNIAGEKLTLYEAVQSHDEQNFIIIGALSKAGLLEQYREEEEAIKTGKKDIKESTTINELDKIIKNFKG